MSAVPSCRVAGARAACRWNARRRVLLPRCLLRTDHAGGWESSGGYLNCICVEQGNDADVRRVLGDVRCERLQTVKRLNKSIILALCGDAARAGWQMPRETMRRAHAICGGRCVDAPRSHAIFGGPAMVPFVDLINPAAEEPNAAVSVDTQQSAAAALQRSKSFPRELWGRMSGSRCPLSRSCEGCGGHLRGAGVALPPRGHARTTVSSTTPCLGPRGFTSAHLGGGCVIFVVAPAVAAWGLDGACHLFLPLDRLVSLRSSSSGCLSLSSCPPPILRVRCWESMAGDARAVSHFWDAVLRSMAPSPNAWDRPKRVRAAKSILRCAGGGTSPATFCFCRGAKADGKPPRLSPMRQRLKKVHFSDHVSTWCSLTAGIAPPRGVRVAPPTNAREGVVGRINGTDGIRTQGLFRAGRTNWLGGISRSECSGGIFSAERLVCVLEPAVALRSITWVAEHAGVFWSPREVEGKKGDVRALVVLVFFARWSLGEGCNVCVYICTLVSRGFAGKSLPCSRAI